MTPREMGRNAFHRLNLQNPLDPLKNVIWDVNFDRFDTQRPGPWFPFDYTADIGFPFLTKNDISFITLGPYQINNADKYITHMQEDHVKDIIADDFDDPNSHIDWEDMDCHMSNLPYKKTVMIYDQYDEPRNWNPNEFDDWFRRRLVYLQVPSLHTNQKYKVVICYDCDLLKGSLPPNFKNRFGFTTPGTRRILDYGCTGRWCRVGGQFGCGIAKMVGPLKQTFCTRINMLKGNFDTD